MLVDREALLNELQRVFDLQTAETLLGVLERVATPIQAALGVGHEDFRELKQIVAALAQAQQRTEQRLEELAQAQQRTEQRVEALSRRMEELAQAQQHTEQRLERLERVVEELAEQVRTLTHTLQRVIDTVGTLKGRMLEWTYRDRAVAYFGHLLRRTRVVAFETIEQTLEAHLTAEEFGDLVLLDVLIKGHPRQRPEGPEVWLAVEVSSVVDEGDVTRAHRRAALLRRAGYPAVPVVAGEQATLGAETEARQHKVVMIQDGRSRLWQEALATWTGDEAV